jgi:ACS family glucarate transporter-like MFS transporter
VSGRGYSETALLLTTWLFAGGAVANVTGGWASDALIKRVGLRAARRIVPFAGLAVSALSLTLTIFVAGKYYLLVLLTSGYFGIAFAQAACWAVCMDVGVRFTGVVSGARNTMSQIGATISSIVFGYMVRSTGSYNIALIPVVGMIAVCGIFCMRIDATGQLFPGSIPGVQTAHSTPTP